MDCFIPLMKKFHETYGFYPKYPVADVLMQRNTKRSKETVQVRVNQELTVMYQEVIRNLESIQGALLRMNRSIQAEGTFGIMKNDRWYKRMKVKTAAQFQKQPNLWGEGKVCSESLLNSTICPKRA